MTLPLHLVPSLAGVRAGDEVAVEGDEAHHAVAVRRLRVGESVVLTDGVGAALTGAVTSTGKRVFTVERPTASRPAPSRSRRSRSCRRCRRATAASSRSSCSPRSASREIVPWAAARSVAVWKGERVGQGAGPLALHRARGGQAVAADLAPRGRRAGRAPTTWSGCCRARRLPSYSTRRRSSRSPTLEVPASGPVVVVVGPEGGSPTTRSPPFVAAGARSVRLGTEVLRTSTAGLAAVSALLSQTSRWR